MTKKKKKKKIKNERGKKEYEKVQNMFFQGKPFFKLEERWRFRKTTFFAKMYCKIFFQRKKDFLESTFNVPNSIKIKKKSENSIFNQKLFYDQINEMTEVSLFPKCSFHRRTIYRNDKG
jgi:hypothetical protein